MCVDVVDLCHELLTQYIYNYSFRVNFFNRFFLSIVFFYLQRIIEHVSGRT